MCSGPPVMGGCGCVPQLWCPNAPAVSPPSPCFLMSEFLMVQATLGMGQNGCCRTGTLAKLFIPNVWH